MLSLGRFIISWTLTAMIEPSSGQHGTSKLKSIMFQFMLNIVAQSVSNQPQPDDRWMPRAYHPSSFRSCSKPAKICGGGRGGGVAAASRRRRQGRGGSR